jgi:hypothetical protein
VLFSQRVVIVILSFEQEGPLHKQPDDGARSTDDAWKVKNVICIVIMHVARQNCFARPSGSLHWLNHHINALRSHASKTAKFDGEQCPP